VDIKKVFKQIFKILEWIIFLTLIFILFLVASPLLPTKTYISTHVVSTGSMEPEIMTGSVVFSTLKNEEVNKGDIVVFKSPDNQEITVIHRVKDINGDQYTTKGDNNENEDSWTLFKSNILGTVIFTIPYLGYVIDFMKTPLGFGLVLGIPALILIISFIKRIKDGINEEVEKRTEEEVFKHRINTPPILPLILLISTFLFLGKPPSTYALFSARVSITGMTISTGEIEERMGEVIINEVMWSGTSLSIDDQYIELRNTTDNDINIGKWKIYYLRDLNKPPIMIPANRVIPKNGYFLISNYSNESNNSLLNIESDMSNASMNLLPTDNGNLILKDSEGNVIDTVLGEIDWPDGLQSPSYRSMQRTVDGIDGSDPSSWYTCNNALCNSSDYWKSDFLLNYGSPNDINITD